MNDCIFCKIVNGEIPSEKVFESENVIGFKDLNPIAPTHILFVPKKHYATLNDISENEIGIVSEMTSAARKAAKDIGIDQSGYRVIMNCNKDAGQVVFHLHMHLVGGVRLGKMG